MDRAAELEQLRHRVNQLEQQLNRLLSDRQQAPSGALVDGDAESEGFSRRRMLRNGLGLSAAAVAGVGMLDAFGSSATAADGDSVKVAQTVSPTATTSAPTRITNPSTATHPSVLFQVDNGTDTQITMPADSYAGVFATATGHDNTTVKGLVGVLGMSDFGVGVKGHSEGDVGVAGASDFDTGVSGTGFTTGVSGTSTNGIGVKAVSTGGDAVVATSGTGYAVHGTSSSQDAAILGDSTDGFGVVGNAGNGVGVGGSGRTGVLAGGSDVGLDSTSSSGIAVKATSTSGTAVRAVSSAGVAVSATSASDVGARLQGGAAAVRLVPQSAAGAPTTGAHQRGEMLVDSRGRLWLCTTTGTPGTWRKVALV